MEKNSISKSCFFIALIINTLLLCSTPTYGWGIAFSDNNIVIRKGETKDFMMNLQNYVGDDPLKITIELAGDTEIVTVLDSRDYYWLPAKTKDYEFPLRFTIPKENAKKEYKVDVKFNALLPHEGIGIISSKIISLSINVPDGDIVQENKPISIEDDFVPVTGPVKEEELVEEDVQEPKAEPSGIVIPEEQGKNALLSLEVGIGVLLIAAIAFLVYSRKRKKHMEGLL